MFVKIAKYIVKFAKYICQICKINLSQLPLVPQPSPGDEKYFSGGEITRMYGSRNGGQVPKQLFVKKIEEKPKFHCAF